MEEAENFFSCTEEIQNFIHCRENTVCIDWASVEAQVGFPIHPDLKDFYSRRVGPKLRGTVNFVEAKFLEQTGNPKFDTWISFNQCEGITAYELLTATSLEKAAQEILWAFREWTGGNSFGHRAMIGSFYLDIGDILILFNNDTGKIEWIDCGYGYFDVYEENPNGVLASDLQCFLTKLCE